MQDGRLFDEPTVEIFEAGQKARVVSQRPLVLGVVHDHVNLYPGFKSDEFVVSTELKRNSCRVLKHNRRKSLYSRDLQRAIDAHRGVLCHIKTHIERLLH